MNPHRIGLFFSFFLAISSPVAQAKTVYVSKAGDGSDGLSWSTAFNEIGSALNESASADSIWVASGVYRETIRLEEGVSVFGGFDGSEDEVQFRDWIANETVLDGSRVGSVVIGADYSLLDGFTITRGEAFQGGGVTCFSSSPTFANCRISNNETRSRRESSCFYGFCIPIWVPGRGAGVYLTKSEAVFLNCEIREFLSNLRRRSLRDRLHPHLHRLRLPGQLRRRGDAPGGGNG